MGRSMTCSWTKCIGTPLLNRTQIGAGRLAQLGAAGITLLVEVEGEILMSRDAMRSATPTAVWTGFQRWSRRSPRRCRRFSKRKVRRVLTGVKMDLEISAFERVSTSPLTRATWPRAQAGTGLMNRRRGYQGHQAGGKLWRQRLM